MTAATFPAVRFPPGPTGVLLPRADRRCAALGVTMYTASKPHVLAAQWAVWFWTRLFGAPALPGSSTRIELPYLGEISSALGLGGSGLLGAAMYQRRDSVRTGETFVATSSKRAFLIKVRQAGELLFKEQRLLQRISDAGPATFRVPRPLGAGQLSDGRAWSAQEMVFTTPHAPCIRLPERLARDLQEALWLAFGVHGPTDGWAPAHRDLTPWNLRRDHRGRVWLFDWEDADLAPPGADVGYFHAALGLVRPRRAMPPLTPEVADYWIDEVERRLAGGHPDNNRIILRRLRAARFSR